MSPTPSPFGTNARRYKNVPKRVKSPKTQSGCLMVLSAAATALVVFLSATASVTW